MDDVSICDVQLQEIQASNIIIIDVAESKRIRAFTFVEFFKIGTLVTLANIGVYYLFITFL